MNNYLNNLFGALSDPTRRAVVERLCKGPATVSTLFENHEMAMPTFMKHLSKLETAGLVKSQKKGRVRTLHIEAMPLIKIQNWISEHQAIWDARLDALTQLTEREDKIERD